MPEAVRGFTNPDGLAINASGEIFVADIGNNRLRKVTSSGVVTEFSGGPLDSLPDDGAFSEGPATTARFDQPRAIAFDSKGNLFVADTNNGRVRKITPDGTASTLAGGTFPDDSAFWGPYALAIDATDNVFIFDRTKILKITPAGVVTPFVGGEEEGYKDASGAEALFLNVKGMAFAPDGTLWVADTGNQRIRKVTPAGAVTTVAGKDLGDSGSSFYKTGGYADGQGAEALFSRPQGIAIDAAGFAYVTDQENRCVRRVSPDGVVTTLTGRKTSSSDGIGENSGVFLGGALVPGPGGKIYLLDGSDLRTLE